MKGGEGLCSISIYHHIEGNLKTKLLDSPVAPENDDDGGNFCFHRNGLVDIIVKGKLSRKAATNTKKINLF